MPRQITTDEIYAVTADDGMIKIRTDMMLVRETYVVELGGRTYHVRQNEDGAVDLCEEI